MNEFMRKFWLSGSNRFALATSAICILLVLTILFGPLLSWFALFYMTGLIYGLDRLTALAAPDHPDQEFPAGEGLLITLGILHIPLLFAGAYAISHAPLAKSIPLFFALALFLGQVSNSNAHELIHRATRWQRKLGLCVYCTLLFGHHTSAHPLVHHIHVATPNDPNTARLGESYYRFFIRAWRGSFREGYRVEKRRKNLRKSYLTYGAGSAMSCIFAYVLGGMPTLLVFIALGLYAQAQLLLSDYVQHYGLMRTKLPSGKFEPVSARHSWNAPQGFSSALMINAPRHSDHHSNPTRAYPGLRLDQQEMPILPQSLPVMATLALIPPVWKRVMDPLAEKWSVDKSSQTAQFPAEQTNP